MDDSENPYEILGVDSKASDAEIKKAYRKLALKNHPDRQSTEEDRERANAIFAKISNAYEILSDEDSRRKFDYHLRNGKGTPNVSSTDNTTTFKTTRKSSPTKTTKTTRTTYTTSSSSPSSSSKQYHQTTTGEGEPQNFTFSFTTNNNDSKDGAFDDPFEVFKKMFREEYGQEFNPDQVPMSSPIKIKTKSRGPKVSSPTKSVQAPPMGSPRTSPQKSFTKTIHLTSPSGKSSKTISPTKIKKTKKKTTTEDSSNQDNDNPVVSMSTKTRTICHGDGTTEVITETTNTRADGSVETKTESVMSKAASTTTTKRTTPARAHVKQIPASSSASPQRTMRTTTWTTSN